MNSIIIHSVLAEEKLLLRLWFPCEDVFNDFSSFSQQQIQDAADQGVLFVGFVQEPYGTPGTRIREPDTPSVSLHSSPTSVLRSLSIGSHSSPSSPTNQPQAEEKQRVEVCEGGAVDGEKPPTGNTGNCSGSELGGSLGGVSPASEGDEQSEEATEDDSPSHNNNKDVEERPRRQRADGESNAQVQLS